MDVKLLNELGLNEAQAKAYITLVKHGSITPPELAKITGETRTNAYSVLDKLVELGLAKKVDNAKKATYRVEHPSNLEKLVRSQRESALQREKLVKDSMPALLNYFYTFSEQPGVRFYQGKEGMEAIYRDQLRTGKPLHVIRSWKDSEYFGKGFFSVWRKKPAMYGIPTTILSPDVEDANNIPELDRKLLWTRTWMKKSDHTAPVEWDIYGDKVSIISFGEEAIGMIIESPQIAESMRQLFKIIQRGLKAAPDYDKLPRLGRLAEDPLVENLPEYQAVMSKVEQRQRRSTPKQ